MFNNSHLVDLAKSVDWSKAVAKTTTTGKAMNTTKAQSFNFTDPEAGSDGKKYRYQISFSINRYEVAPTDPAAKQLNSLRKDLNKITDPEARKAAVNALFEEFMADDEDSASE